MRSRISRLAVVGTAIMSCLLGCSSTRPTPNMPEPAPPAIPVVGDSLPTIAFDKLVVDIPDHRIIGYHHEGMENTRLNQYWWGPEIERETDKLNDVCRARLAEAGYRVAVDGSAALVLVGAIREFSFNSYYYKSSFDQVACELKWELFRAGEKKPRFTGLTRGAGRVNHNEPGAIQAAFETALGRLLATEEFVAAVRE